MQKNKESQLGFPIRSMRSAAWLSMGVYTDIQPQPWQILKAYVFASGCWHCATWKKTEQATWHGLSRYARDILQLKIRVRFTSGLYFAGLLGIWPFRSALKFMIMHRATIHWEGRPAINASVPNIRLIFNTNFFIMCSKWSLNSHRYTIMGIVVLYTLLSPGIMNESCQELSVDSRSPIAFPRFCFRVIM